MNRAGTPRHRWQKIQGFTLIELMIVLTIAGIALTLALPGFGHLIRRHQLTTIANDLHYAVQLTRTEAIRRNHMVQLAPIDGHDWSSGWRIYVSGSEQAGTVVNTDYRSGDPVIRQHAALPEGMYIESTVRTHGEIYIAYNGGGRSTRRNGLMLLGTWRLRMGNEARKMVINAQGRTRLCNPAKDRNCH
jgi:type IV fimbrial biogenesis protein FimT